jgi:hypothetical protein
MSHMQPGGGVTIIDRVTGAPVPVTMHQLTNSAGEKFGWTIDDIGTDAKPLIGDLTHPQYVSGHDVAEIWADDERGIRTRIALRLGVAVVWGDQSADGIR